MSARFSTEVMEGMAEAIRTYRLDSNVEQEGQVLLFNEYAILWIATDRWTLITRLIAIERGKCFEFDLDGAMRNRMSGSLQPNAPSKPVERPSIKDQVLDVNRDLIEEWSDIMAGDHRWLRDHGYLPSPVMGDFCTWIVEATKHRYGAKHNRR
jgi:hypothetical protein